MHSIRFIGSAALQAVDRSCGTLNRGQREIRRFQDFCIQRFGSMVRAWKAFDLNGSMQLQRCELLAMCDTLGYKGDWQALWRYLDRSSSEMVTLVEFDVRAAIELAAFKKWAADSFGEDIDDMLRSLGFEDCKEASPEDFTA